MATHITKELVERYLQGECTPEEKIQVETYLQKSSNLSLLEAVLENYWTDTQEHPATDIDTETSLQNFKEKREQLGLAANKSKKSLLFYLSRHKLAWAIALLCVLVSCSVVWYICWQSRCKSYNSMRCCITTPNGQTVYAMTTGKNRAGFHYLFLE